MRWNRNQVERRLRRYRRSGYLIQKLPNGWSVKKPNGQLAMTANGFTLGYEVTIHE